MRRQIRVVTVFGPAVMAVAVAALFSLKGGFTMTKTAVLAPIVWALAMPVMIRVSGRMLGSTTVGLAGLRTRTLVTRRAIPWDEVTALEIHTLSGRGGNAGHILQAHRANGRPLDLPGVFATSSRAGDPEFVATVEAIRAAWGSATGRP